MDMDRKFDDGRMIRSILAQANTGLWMIELEDGKEPRMYVESAMRGLLGIEEELSPEECYRFWYSRIYLEDEIGIQEAVGRILSMDFAEVQYSWNHPKLGRVFVRCGGICRERREGFAAMSGYHQNVTELVELSARKDEALKQAGLAAEAAGRAKTDFLSRMSHDMRTPISTILGSAQVARAKITDPEAVEKNLDQISACASALLSMVNNLLDMTRIESGQHKQEHICLEELLHECVYDFQPEAVKKNIKFTGRCDISVHKTAFGDKGRIRQIMDQLVSNGIRYTDPGGRVELVLGEIPGTSSHLAGYRILCRDTGQGIPEDMLPKIFEAFVRGGDTRLGQKAGAGLGLAVVRNLVNEMNGWIDVESREGEGSCFTVVIYLPLEREAGEEKKTQSEEREENAPSVPALKGLSILLAEDNELNRELEEEILQMEGAVVFGTENGKEALEAFKNNPGFYDAVLLDINMPVMNGMETARAIRSLPEGRTVPLIALTANAFAEDVDAGRKAGIDIHLTKPICPQELEKALKWVKREK